MNHSKILDLADIKYFCEFDKVWKIEQWKDVLGYENIYKVSDLGRVKSLSRIVLNHGVNAFLSKEKILNPTLLKSGYYSVALRLNNKQKTYSIHQLGAISFLGHKPCKFKLVVNHKNINKIDNRILNLEIVTNRQNSNQKHIPHSSKFTGVSFIKKRNLWHSRIVVKGKLINLGYYINENEASIVYEDKLKEIEND